MDLSDIFINFIKIIRIQMKDIYKFRIRKIIIRRYFRLKKGFNLLFGLKWIFLHIYNDININIYIWKQLYYLQCQSVVFFAIKYINN